MAEYIERETAIATIMSEPPDAHYPHWYADKIKAIPATDVVPVQHGRWMLKRHKIFGNSYDYMCSVCGCDYALAEYNYCPHCGAKMDLEENDG